MGRKNQRHFLHRKSDLEANREVRGGRVLKVFRRVDDEDASIISGAVADLAHDNTIPMVRTSTKLDVFVFDPRLMPRNFNDGFVSGYQFGQVVSGIDRTDRIDDEGYEVAVGEVTLLPRNRKTLVARLDSERLLEERTEIYRILGSSGVRGFTETGARSGRRIVTSPTVAIGTFKHPIAKDDEGEIIEAIEDTLAVALPGKGAIMLGQLEIKSYSQD